MPFPGSADRCPGDGARGRVPARAHVPGTQVLFDSGSRWLRIENPARALPRGIVAGPVEEWLDEQRPAARVLLLEHTDGYAVGLDTRELVRFDTDFSVTISPWEVAEDGAVSD